MQRRCVFALSSTSSPACLFVAQLRGQYETKFKSKRWYMCIFHFLLDLAITNCFIVFKASYEGRPPRPQPKTHKEFRLQLVKELLEHAEQLRARHNAQQVPGVAPGRGPAPPPSPPATRAQVRVRARVAAADAGDESGFDSDLDSDAGPSREAASEYAPRSFGTGRPSRFKRGAPLPLDRFSVHLPLRLPADTKRACDLCGNSRATVVCTCGYRLCLTVDNPCYAKFHDSTWKPMES